MKSETLKQQLMDQVLRFVGGRIEKARAPQVESFVRQFYANVPVADIAQDSPEDLFCAALSLWQFAHKRQPKTAKVRVFNPHQDEHGWRSSHTIVEIVNDDMPFLVDSVTAELARQDLDVHLVVHPIVRIARDKSGQMTEIGKPDAKNVGAPESIMQIRTTQVAQPEKLEEMKRGIESVLADVRNAVTDFQAMRDRLRGAIQEIDSKKLPVGDEERAETSRFLKWIEDDQFRLIVFLV
jgi:glutamate dehydrogenase